MMLGCYSCDFYICHKPKRITMTQYPFTSQGMADLTAALYALPDSSLKVQVNALVSNPAQWISNNFSLDTSQQTYLSGLSATALDNIAGITAWFFSNRLPVYLNVSEPKENKHKWVHLYNDGNLLADDNGAYTPGGSLTIAIEYR